MITRFGPFFGPSTDLYTRTNERNHTHYPFTCEKKIFETRDKEHLHSFRNNNTNSKFSQQLLENGYAFRKIDGVMNIKHLARKCAHMDIMERFFIYEGTKKNNQLNDKNSVSYSKSFKVIFDRDRHLTS